MKKLWLASCLVLSACGPEVAPLEVSIYGEDYIEEEIPSSDVADGWRVQFDRFLVSVGQVSAARGHEPADLVSSGWRVFDLARSSAGEGFTVLEAEVPVGRYDHVEYRIAPPTTGEAEPANAEAADVQRLIDLGASIYVEGSAEKDGSTKRFTWAFDTDTLYTHCESTAEVRAGATARTQLTIHGDHLFYDDLIAEEPAVAFQIMADADADGDGEITADELRARDIRTESRYQVGSTGIADLWNFTRFQTTTLGHIDGEGHCDVERK